MPELKCFEFKRIFKIINIEKTLFLQKLHYFLQILQSSLEIKAKSSIESSSGLFIGFIPIFIKNSLGSSIIDFKELDIIFLLCPKADFIILKKVFHLSLQQVIYLFCPFLLQQIQPQEED